MHKKGHVIIVILILLMAMFSFGYLAGRAGDASYYFADEPETIDNTASDGRVNFGLFWSAWDLLKKKYVESADLNAQDLVYGAINGMFAATGDPYTTFLDPQQNQTFHEELDGSFQGIGAEIGIKDNLLTIIAPLDESPAERSGLLAGDRIVNIDGAPAVDLSIEEAVLKIRGKKGTDVILTIFRDGEDDTQDITITRDDIIIRSVRLQEVVGGVAVIRLAQFGDDTYRELVAALDDASRQGMQSAVLDVRNNPGGLLTVAVDVTSLFVPRETTVLKERDANGQERLHVTKRSPLYQDLPLVMIQNQGSASASEILVGALADFSEERVRVIGETSFGKGSVQELVPMREGTAAKITVAKWFTPRGRAIDGVGLEPDEVVDLTSEDVREERDPQRDRAVELLQEGQGADVTN